MKKYLPSVLLVAGLAALGIASIVQTTVVMDGTTISSRVKTIGGEAWIPVSDLARAKGLQVQSSGNTINLTTPGGANQVKGTNGKLGEMLFSGKWRLQIDTFSKVKRYTIQNETTTDYSVFNGVANLNGQVFTAKSGFELYVAKCTIKNARKDSAQFDWNPIDNQSSVANADGSNSPWLVYDIPSPAFVSSPILPGSKIDFNICFAVAKGSKPSEIVFMAKGLLDSKPDIFRISVTDAPTSESVKHLGG